MSEHDAVYAQLEERIERLAQVLSRLKARNAELETLTAAATAERDATKEQLALAQGELTELRGKSKDAASRVKNLLSQIEQLDLLTER